MTAGGRARWTLRARESPVREGSYGRTVSVLRAHCLSYRYLSNPCGSRGVSLVYRNVRRGSKTTGHWTLNSGPASFGKFEVLSTWIPALCSPLNGVTLLGQPAFWARARNCTGFAFASGTSGYAPPRARLRTELLRAKA
jgi:hypothetical protein